MIKIDGHSIEIDGDGLQLMLELANLIRFMGYKKNIIPKDMMLHCVDAAYMSDEELKQDNINKAKAILARLENDGCCFDGNDDEPCDHFKSLFGDLLGDNYD